MAAPAAAPRRSDSGAKAESTTNTRRNRSRTPIRRDPKHQRPPEPKEPPKRKAESSKSSAPGLTPKSAPAAHLAASDDEGKGQEPCPFHLLAAQVAFASTVPGNTGNWLFPSPSGEKPTKQGWVKTFTEIAKRADLQTHWENGALKHTGHSARAYLASADPNFRQVVLSSVRSSPLASMCSLASESAIASSIAAAKLELRALTASSVPICKDPKEVIPVSEEMIAEASPEAESPTQPGKSSLQTQPWEGKCI